MVLPIWYFLIPAISVNLSNFGWAISDSKLTDCIVAIMNIGYLYFKPLILGVYYLFESGTTPSGLNLKASGSGETGTKLESLMPSACLTQQMLMNCIACKQLLIPETTIVCLNLLINCTLQAAIVGNFISASCSSVCSK